MNDFQSTVTGEALLKNTYAAGKVRPSPLEEALRRRRLQLSQTKLGPNMGGLNEISDNLVEREPNGKNPIY